MKLIIGRLIIVATILIAFWLPIDQTEGSSIKAFPCSNALDIIGAIGQHVIKKEETLLDVARMYDLGFNEIQDLYPGWDPWIPPAGSVIRIPSQWIIPEGLPKGILINTAELRLYLFDEKNAVVITFPVGVGDQQSPTPTGDFHISVKIVNPTWTVPASLRDRHEVWTVLPGPDNPLGKYWLGLDDTGYGIHGTNFPWSVGRDATQGCIRLYPEDIPKLFELVEIGTRVKIIYEPIKISKQMGKVFIEVHKDVYGKIDNLKKYALARLSREQIIDRIDFNKLDLALQRQNGLPEEIGVKP